jgi:hypothetical protein
MLAQDTGVGDGAAIEGLTTSAGGGGGTLRCLALNTIKTSGATVNSAAYFSNYCPALLANGDDQWHHVIFAWSLPTVQIYVDGVDVREPSWDVVSGTAPASLEFGRYDLQRFLGNTDTGTGVKFTAGLVSQLYFAPGQYLDISSGANLEKFRLPTGKPADLGADGSTPTGLQPAVYSDTCISNELGLPLPSPTELPNAGTLDNLEVWSLTNGSVDPQFLTLDYYLGTWLLFSGHMTTPYDPF